MIRIVDKTKTAQRSEKRTASPSKERGEKRKLRIGQIAKRAGVAPSVITYYLSEGLLPKPVKTSRNMAYYDEDTVGWVKLIRELQQNAFLPLKVVKKIVTSGSTVEQIRETFVGRATAQAAKSLEPIDEDTLVADGHVTKKALRRLEQMGVLTPRQSGGRRTYSADDAAIVRQLVRMREAGLTPERGFGVDQMRIYQDAVEQLVREEVRFAIEGVVGKIEPDRLGAVAETWMDAADEILRTLHRKVLKRMIRELRSGMTEP